MIGAKFAAENFPSIVQGEVDFSAANPKVKRWIDAHVGELIVQVDRDARESVKDIVTRAFNRGLPPLESAKLVKQVVPLSGRYAVALDNHRAGLVEQGLSATRVDQLSNEYADRLLTSRAESIARTETANALNQGQQLLWEQSADEGLIDKDKAKRQWVIDPVTAKGCPVCEPMDGQTVGLYEPFTTGLGDEVFAPVAHPRCNCLINLIL
jgi:hypothetical protein